MRRNIAIVALVEAVDVLAYVLLMPHAQATAARFHLGTTGLWALFAAPVAAAAIGAAVFLPASERHGRKPLLVATCLVTAEALFVLAWASDVYMLAMARLMAGLAAGNIAVAEAVLHDGSAVKRPIVTTALACAAGLVGGWLLGSAAPLGAGAYLAGAVAALALVGVVSLLPETRPRHAAGIADARSPRGAAR